MSGGGGGRHRPPPGAGCTPPTSDPGPRRGVELHDLELERRRRAVELDLRRGVQRAAAAHVHLEAVRAHRRDVLEQHDPLGALAARGVEALARELLAALARELAVAVAE